MPNNWMPPPYKRPFNTIPLHANTDLPLKRQHTHTHLRHLIDHSLCNKINIYRCTHYDCATNKSNFFHSQRALSDHNKEFHPITCLPIDMETSTPSQTIVNSFFDGPGSSNLENNWNQGYSYIFNNYQQEPPNFRSNWRRFLSGNNKKRFNFLLKTIITTIVENTHTDAAEILWWLLFNFERLILAPTPTQDRSHSSIKHTITQCLLDFRCGNIQSLLEHTIFNNNTSRDSLPNNNRGNNKAAQIAADSDNYRTAVTRATAFNKIATITHRNLHTVKKLHPPPCIPDDTNSHTPITHFTNNQILNLPGDVCTTIRTSGKHKGTGLQTDSIDLFISLVKLNEPTTNKNIQQLFNHIYQGKIPTRAKHFFTDTYLFCLHKDQHDESKLRPIGIPSAIRRIIASHIAKQWQDKFALHLLPYNYAVGVQNGMNFIIKAMQLWIDKFIIQPQKNNSLPSRATIFVNLTNMFNSVSRHELFDIIQSDFPELTPLTSL